MRRAYLCLSGHSKPGLRSPDAAFDAAAGVGIAIGIVVDSGTSFRLRDGLVQVVLLRRRLLRRLLVFFVIRLVLRFLQNFGEWCSGGWVWHEDDAWLLTA